MALTVGPDDSVFAWTDAVPQVQKFTPEGVFRCRFGPFTNVDALDTDPSGNLYILEGDGQVADTMSKFGPTP